MDIEERHSSALGADERREVIALCDAAYEEETARYFADIGAGWHLLGRVDGVLVAHLMFVTRTLQPADGSMLRTAYVELVATHPAHQGRGHASALLRAVPALVADFDLAALSPSDEGFYARLGWTPWRGPLLVRTAGGVEPTPEETIMILRTPRTPATLDLDGALSVEWRPGEVW